MFPKAAHRCWASLVSAAIHQWRPVGDWIHALTLPACLGWLWAFTPTPTRWFRGRMRCRATEVGGVQTVLTLLLQWVISICTKQNSHQRILGWHRWMGFRQVPIVSGIIISITHWSSSGKRQIVSCCLAAVHDVPEAAQWRSNSVSRNDRISACCVCVCGLEFAN